MTNKQRRPIQDLPIANISLKQFDAETRTNFAPEAIEKKAIEPDVASVEQPVDKPASIIPPTVASEKETKRLTIDLDDVMNYKFTLYALEQGKKKTEVIREWIAAAISGR